MERLFDLDYQLLSDSILTMIAIFFLFLLMSYLLFNPVRKMLKDRQDKIQGNLNDALSDKDMAAKLKLEYEGKLSKVEKEAEEILSEARKKAKNQEVRIMDEAKQEAARIIKHANEEAVLERKRAMDEMKREIITIASLMAGKVVTASINTEIQDTIIEETLKEIGDSTWQS